MKKSTKGAFAAGAAGVLLLGGAGSLAYWSDAQDVDGGTLTSGDMRISAPSCGAGWTLDAGEDGPGAAFDPATDLLVPGDVITQTCTTTFTGTGEHLRATLDATPGTGSDGLFAGASPMLTLAVGSLESSSDGTTWVAVPTTGLTEANDGDQVRVALTVTFNSAAANPTTAAPAEPETRNVASVLDDITITAEQVHS